MRKLFQSVLLLLSIIMAGQSVFAQTSDNERIVSFESDIVINKDSTVRVKEIIEYDMGNTPNHGIYRTIPLTSSQERTLKISDVTVEGKQFSVNQDNGSISIKIGDANTLVSGVQTYAIAYIVTNPFGFFNDRDELYWNVTGNEWKVPIERARARIAFDPGIIINSETPFSEYCYQGSTGSKEKCTSQSLSGIRGANFETTRMLNPGEGMTVAYGFPKGVVILSNSPIVSDSFKLFSIITIGLLFLLFLITSIIRWYRFGRDAKSAGVIVPQYQPQKGMNVFIANSLFDKPPFRKAYFAQIVDLAVRGHIIIERLEKRTILSDVDYKLYRVSGPGELNEFDRFILNNLFVDNAQTTLLSNHSLSLNDDINNISAFTMQDIVTKGWYQPASLVGNKFPFIMGSVVVVLIFIIEYFTFDDLSYSIYLGIAIYFIAIIMSRIMDRLTDNGIIEKDYLLGLKEYIEVAEKDRINFHSAPEKKQKLFEQLLPYAMIFGIEKQWARSFESIVISTASWYRSNNNEQLNTLGLVGSLQSFSFNNFGNLPDSSTSGSSGGGFSGGGGGGGGGGSW